MKQKIPVHPFLFALYPVLFLYSHNAGHLSWEVILVPCALSLCFALLIVGFLRLFIGDIDRAGMTASFFILSFLSYRPMFLAIRWLLLPGKMFFSPLWVAFLIIGIMLILRIPRRAKNATKILNLVSGVLVLMVAFSILTFEGKSHFVFKGAKRAKIEKMLSMLPENKDPNPPSDLPDIYYIILDAYGRSDVLKDIYGYDNHELIDFLKEKGFYVAEKSTANYRLTALSLSSSLNYIYLNELIPSQLIQGNNYRLLGELIYQNRLWKFLKSQGYKVVTFASGYHITDIFNQDDFKAPGMLNGSSFFTELIANTPLDMLAKHFPEAFSWFDRIYRQRKRILYAFDELPRVAIGEERPLFVFAHIICPHYPFVFNSQVGDIEDAQRSSLLRKTAYLSKNEISREKYKKIYREQAMFVSQKAQEAIQGILQKAQRPSIIILQADHGPGSMLHWLKPDEACFQEKFPILNAYYFPDGDYQDLYQDISPVNTFRVILNKYWNAGLTPLEDKSYFSLFDRPYELTDVTESVR